MDQGQVRAADAAEKRRLEKGLTQRDVGVDAKTWRALVQHKRWPSEPLTRSRIEAHLDWRLGALQRIADGTSTPEQETLEPVAEPAADGIPPELGQAQALLDEIKGHVAADEPAMARIKLDITSQLIDGIRKALRG